MTTDEVRELIIIGSGPAGYTAAVYAARAQLRPLVFEGTQFGGALMTTTEVENYPGFTDGIMGPELMEQMRDQASRFGAELRAEDVEEVSLTGPVKTVTAQRRHLPRPRGHPRHGRGRPLPERPRRAAAARPRRERLRHLRRLLLPRPGHRRGRRRRLGDGGGDLPHPLRPLGDDRAPPRRVPRLQDHARAREERPEDALADQRRGHRGARRRQRCPVCGFATRAPARSRRWTSPACSSRSATTRAASWSAASSTPTTPATC